MDGMIESAFAGLIAALTATVILGIASWIRRKQLIRADREHIKSVVEEGRKRVLTSKDTFAPGPKVTLLAKTLRAAQYNLMINQLRIALDEKTTNLPYGHRKDIFNALDWFRTNSPYFVVNNSSKRITFPRDLPDGLWAAEDMSESNAVETFEKLESISWLDLGPYVDEGKGG